MATAFPVRPRRDPIHTGLHSLLALIVTLLGFLVLIYTILWITKGRFLKPYFEKYASRYAERPVRVAGAFELYLNPHVHFRADGLSVGNPPWAKRPQLFEGRRLELELHTLPLILGTRRFRYVTLDGGRADLEWNRTRKNTWTFGPKSAEPPAIPAIERLGVTDTHLDYADPALALTLGVEVGDIAGANSRIDGAIGFKGRGQAHGKPFALQGRLLAPNATLAGGRNPLEAHVQVGDARIDVTGTLPGATVLEGADLKLHARGRDFNTPLGLLGVTAVTTRSYDLTSNLTKHGIEWRFTRIGGGFGDSDIAGRATLSLPNNRLLIVGDLSSRKLDILDVGPWIGFDPAALNRGTAIKTVGGAPRVIPDAHLASESLKLFDARVRYRAAAVRTGSLPISDLVMGVDLDHRRLRLAPLDLTVAGGRFTGEVTLNARVSPVVTDYDFRLGRTPIPQLLNAFHVPLAGTTGTMHARLQLRGYGDTMHRSLASASGRIAVVMPGGTLALGGSELAELNLGRYLESFLSKTLKRPTNVRCGLIAFTVKDGAATADPILIDGDRTAIRATGGFRFADESLALKIKADSKRFSIFSGQSPIRLGGYFAKTRVNPISGELLTRAGAAVVLGVVATPFAALAPFIDLGDGKTSACGPILAGAHADAMRTITKKARRTEDRGRR